HPVPYSTLFRCRAAPTPEANVTRPTVAKNMRLVSLSRPINRPKRTPQTTPKAMVDRLHSTTVIEAPSATLVALTDASTKPSAKTPTTSLTPAHAASSAAALPLPRRSPARLIAPLDETVAQAPSPNPTQSCSLDTHSSTIRPRHSNSS